jgi:hypothetical protein
MCRSCQLQSRLKGHATERPTMGNKIRPTHSCDKLGFASTSPLIELTNWHEQRTIISLGLRTLSNDGLWHSQTRP